MIQKSSSMLAALVGFLCALGLLALIIQTALEVGYWLINARWFDFDWFRLLSSSQVLVLTNTPLLGLNSAIVYLLGTWVSVFPAALAVIQISIIGLNRWAMEKTLDFYNELWNPILRRNDLLHTRQEIDRLHEEFVEISLMCRELNGNLRALDQLVSSFLRKEREQELIKRRME